VTNRKNAIRVKVAPTNPGQYFAACGLFELADRRWRGAEAWFDRDEFHIGPVNGTLTDLLEVLGKAELAQVDEEGDLSSPIEVGAPFNLRLDWWTDEQAGGKQLKVWAGSMRSVRIARAMQNAINKPELQTESLFGQGMVVYDPD
jgi:hypothetical protein